MPRQTQSRKVPGRHLVGKTDLMQSVNVGCPYAARENVNGARFHNVRPSTLVLAGNAPLRGAARRPQTSTSTRECGVSLTKPRGVAHGPSKLPSGLPG